jgi:hypothetical protein
MRHLAARLRERPVTASSQPSRILAFADRRFRSRPDLAGMDHEGLAGCSEANRQMLVVAEGLVLGEAAPAERCPGQGLRRAVRPLHPDLADDEERAVPHRSDGRSRVSLRRAAVPPAVEQCAAGAALDHLGDGIGVGLVGQDPWSAVGVEDAGMAPEAFTDMDAEVEVEAHLDVGAAIGLPHIGSTLPASSSLDRRRAGLSLNWSDREGSGRLVLATPDGVSSISDRVLGTALSISEIADRRRKSGEGHRRVGHSGTGFLPPHGPNLEGENKTIDVFVE